MTASLYSMHFLCAAREKSLLTHLIQVEVLN